MLLNGNYFRGNMALLKVSKASDLRMGDSVRLVNLCSDKGKTLNGATGSITAVPAMENSRYGVNVNSMINLSLHINNLLRYTSHPSMVKRADHPDAASHAEWRRRREIEQGLH